MPLHSLPPPPSGAVSDLPQTSAVAISPSQELTVWSQQRLDLLKKTFAANLTDLEFELFIEVCKRRQLDPFSKQIYAVKRAGNLTIQTSIDGYRLIAERTGKYLGQTSPYWCGSDGVWKDVWTSSQNPFAAKVGVHKQGQLEPTWGIAYWNTYVAPGPFWNKAGAHMLSKCAEALALKKAFPEELSGLYTDDEMEQADVKKALSPAFEEAKALLDSVQDSAKLATLPEAVQAELVMDADGNFWPKGSEPKQEPQEPQEPDGKW